MRLRWCASLGPISAQTPGSAGRDWRGLPLALELVLLGTWLPAAQDPALIAVSRPQSVSGRGRGAGFDAAIRSHGRADGTAVGAFERELSNRGALAAMVAPGVRREPVLAGRAGRLHATH
jgi:hypothetical protein